MAWLDPLKRLLGTAPAGRSEVLCLITHNLADLHCLQSLNSDDLRGLFAFFGRILGHEPEVREFLERSREGFELTDLMHFVYHVCLPKSGELQALDMVPFGAPSTADARAAKAGLVAQKWVRNVWICEADLVPTYRDLLAGFNNQLLVARDHPDKWQPFWLHLHTVTLGPRYPYPYDPADPVNEATRRLAAARCLFIFAAGNEAKVTPELSMNPWAVAPWVVGVGATNGEGTELLTSSSRGTAGAPRSGPTIVAPGVMQSWATALGHGHSTALRNLETVNCKTSVFAHIGGRIVVYKTNSQGATEVGLIDGGGARSLPLDVVRESVGGLAGQQPDTQYGTSFAAPYVAAICQIGIEKVVALGVDVAPADRPKLIKAMLQEMARPLPAYQPHEQGSGCVTRGAAEAYLAQLTAARVEEIAKRAARSW